MAPSNWNHLNRGPGHRYSDEERTALLRGFEQFGGSLYPGFPETPNYAGELMPKAS